MDREIEQLLSRILELMRRPPARRRPAPRTTAAGMQTKSTPTTPQPAEEEVAPRSRQAASDATAPPVTPVNPTAGLSQKEIQRSLSRYGMSNADLKAFGFVSPNPAPAPPRAKPASAVVPPLPRTRSSFGSEPTALRSAPKTALRPPAPKTKLVKGKTTKLAPWGVRKSRRKPPKTPAPRSSPMPPRAARVPTGYPAEDYKVRTMHATRSLKFFRPPGRAFRPGPLAPRGQMPDFIPGASMATPTGNSGAAGASGTDNKAVVDVLNKMLKKLDEISNKLGSRKTPIGGSGDKSPVESVL